jgi:MULE transposase domain
VTNYLAYRKRKLYGRVGNITLENLRAACEPYLETPENMDQAYVIGFDTDITDPEQGKFCIVWSTRRLSTNPTGEVLHSDCTYKITWNSFPVTIMGYTDKNRRFHPTILAISTNETADEFKFMLSAWLSVNPALTFKFIMADGAEAVANAARFHWPNIGRLMCFAHVFMVSNPCTVFLHENLFLFFTRIRNTKPKQCNVIPFLYIRISEYV